MSQLKSWEHFVHLILYSPGCLVSAGSEERSTGLRHSGDLLHVHAVPLEHRPQLKLAGLLVPSHHNCLVRFFLESEIIILYTVLAPLNE